MISETLEAQVLGSPHTPSVAPAPLLPGTVVVGGKTYWLDAEGNLTPEELVKGKDKLVDQTVRQIVGFALELEARVSRFHAHTFSDLAALSDILAEQHGVKAGGRRGNVSFFSRCGRYRVQIQIAARIVFGPELQIAKALIDECLIEWSEGSRAEIRALVSQAFDVDKDGQLNRSAIFALRRLDIDDPRWLRAMDAIEASILVIGRKSYLRFSQRDTHDGEWRSIRIDLAAAGGAQ
jgi:hypothetical protein